MTLGIHVAQGPRNGYGPFCSAKPAVVTAVNEGGSLTEAKANSGGYTYTVFRDTTVYLEAPPEWNTAPDMAALARAYYPRLKAKWDLNPADWYQITNEQGGGEGAEVERNLTRLIAYEREIARLANLDGKRVGVLALAGGSPGDFELWKCLCAPFINEMWLAGNAYLRHAYGTGDLCDAQGNVISGNPSRPIQEADYLYTQGYRGPLIVTEAGIDGGFGYAGTRFTDQLQKYSRALRSHPLILGCCGWTLGNWENQQPNCQDSLPALSQYLLANPVPKWAVPPPPEPEPDPCEGRPRVQYKRSYVLLPPTATEQWAEQALKGSFGQRLTLGFSADDAGIGALDVRNILAVNPDDWGGDLRAFYEEYYPGVNYIPLTTISPYQMRQYLQFYNNQTGAPPVLPAFTATHWPTNYRTINQLFGANPCNYCKFGTESHEGLDVQAPLGSPVYAIAQGTVYLVVTNPAPSENYGKQVRVRHANGFWSVYAHLESIVVTAGQTVVGGQRLGTADSTGNSTGSHLHLGLGHDDPRMGVGNLRYIDPLPYVAHLMNQPPPYVYSGPPVTFSPSLHAPGSDYEWGIKAVQDMYKRLNIPVKWMSNGVSANYYPLFNKPAFHIVRVFWKPDRKKTPQEAWDQDLRDGVMRFYNAGARRFELLNEPNLADEGAGLVWANGTELGNWLLGLISIMRANCPGSKLYFPGMSPGVPWTNQFVWTDPAWAIVKSQMDGFCLHAYSGNATSVTAAANEITSQVIEAQRYLRLQVPLVLSESSVNRAATATHKAQVYRAVEASLRPVAGIEAVSWYISSWADAPPDQDVNQESWLKYGIADAYLAIP